MRKIKHFAGYGTVLAEKVKDDTCTLHIKVVGDHERGLYPSDGYSAYYWLVHRFMRNAPDYVDAWPVTVTHEYGFVQDKDEPLLYHECCDIRFNFTVQQ